MTNEEIAREHSKEWRQTTLLENWPISSELIDSIENEVRIACVSALNQATEGLKKERDKWKAGHDEMVKRNQLLRYRTDLPFERARGYDAMIAERDAINVANSEMRDALTSAKKSLGICYSDSHAMKVEWFEEQGFDTCAMCIRNIRKWSELPTESMTKALSSSAGESYIPSSKLEEALRILRECFELVCVCRNKALSGPSSDGRSANRADIDFLTNLHGKLHSYLTENEQKGK